MNTELYNTKLEAFKVVDNKYKQGLITYESREAFADKLDTATTHAEVLLIQVYGQPDHIATK